MPFPPNRTSGYQSYLNSRGRTSTPDGGWTPENFNRAWVGVGGSNRYWATPEMRQSWQSAMQGYRTRVASFRDGVYGFQGGAGQPWRPFQQQPQSSPQFITNPTGYSRNQLWGEYQTAMDEAKAKTEARYQEALANLDDVGIQQRADIDTQFDSGRSSVDQSLVDAGLSGTSVLPSMRRGVERERMSAQNRLAAMLARERNQIIQSRNDIPPNLEMLMQLMVQQGRGGR